MDYNRKEIQTYIDLALNARKNAYAPYSHFAVGACAVATDGTFYTGCNIENASYPAGICAERAAISKAVSDGKRNFSLIVVAAEKIKENFTSPCGICLQTMSEFCSPDTVIVLADPEGNVCTRLLKEFISFPFRFSHEEELC